MDEFGNMIDATAFHSGISNWATCVDQAPEAETRDFITIQATTVRKSDGELGVYGAEILRVTDLQSGDLKGTRVGVAWTDKDTVFIADEPGLFVVRDVDNYNKTYASYGLLVYPSGDGLGSIAIHEPTDLCLAARSLFRDHESHESVARDLT